MEQLVYLRNFFWGRRIIGITDITNSKYLYCTSLLSDIFINPYACQFVGFGINRMPYISWSAESLGLYWRMPFPTQWLPRFIRSDRFFVRKLGINSDTDLVPRVDDSGNQAIKPGLSWPGSLLTQIVIWSLRSLYNSYPFIRLPTIFRRTVGGPYLF